MGSIPVPLGKLFVLSPKESSIRAGPAGDSGHGSSDGLHDGLLIVNADDWGRDHKTTERILDCVLCGAVSSVSAMVFMEDSERAAAIARERGIDAGLHLNFTTPFSAPSCPARLVECQCKLARYLRRHRFAPTVFLPLVGPLLRTRCGGTAKRIPPGYTVQDRSA
jgi:hypothetical protein